jgi:hypothetical protein
VGIINYIFDEFVYKIFTSTGIVPIFKVMVNSSAGHCAGNPYPINITEPPLIDILYEFIAKLCANVTDN